jgi:N-acetylmuramoyl-L-alanine amidase
MLWGKEKIARSFAGTSLGFVLALTPAVVPCSAAETNKTASADPDSATAQLERAQQMREALNNKPADQRTLAEYKKIVTSYQRIYLVTPHAAEVPDALEAAAELNVEMGDHFGRSYYQSGADTYTFLIHEYPNSKHAQEAMLRLAKLQKDQLGDPNAAMRTFQDFQKKYPHSTHKREVQEELAELTLMRGADSGAFATNAPKEFSIPAAVQQAPAEPRTEPASASGSTSTPAVGQVHAAISGGEPAKSIAVPHVQKIRTNATSDSAEVIIDLEDSVQYTSGRVTNPDRIFFDLHKARLSPALARGDIHVGGNLLTNVRVAQNHAGVVRVVLDVHDVRDYAVSLSKKPMRLVIELYSTAGRAPMEAAAKQKNNAEITPVAATSSPVKSSSTTTVADTSSVVPAEPPAAPAKNSAALKSFSAKTAKTKPDLMQPATAPQPTRDGQSTLTRALGLKIGRIVIDPGHGGHDTGTIGPTGLMEKDLCLDVALRLGKIMQQKLPGADIVYTRSDDTFIPLEERTRIANDAKADLFVSIHANSSPNHGARGVETYYLNLKGSPEAMEVAARENAASDQGIHDLEDLVKKITRTEKIDESKEFAEDVQESLSKRIQRTANPVKNRGVRKAPFVVLIGADMPSILTEISFLSNPSDEQLLKKPDHRQRVAEGIYAGVAAYLQSLNSVALNGAPKPTRGTSTVAAVEQTRNQK